MKVEIVNHTTDALELLIFTKSGRLATGTTLEDICKMSDEEKMEQLSYPELKKRIEELTRYGLPITIEPY